MPQQIKKPRDRFALFSSCKKYNIPLSQCPQFLFLLMGLIIVAAIVITYFLARLKVGDPRIVSLIELIITSILMVIDYVIINSFERMAEASRMKTEFIGIVSHQLRSPLANIKFSVDLMLSGDFREKGGSDIEYLQILRENVQRMNDLINDLLLISRIETGEFPINRERVDIGEVIKGTISKFRPFAEASNVEIITDIEEGLPVIMVDSLWLEQVFKNLIDNAIRYIDGHGRVDVAARHSGGNVLFSVKDTGVGIPKNEQKYIFQKFFRSRNAARHQTEGSGLGLHIVRKIINLFGGEIRFTSEEGKGTTFFFTLPAKLVSGKKS